MKVIHAVVAMGFALVFVGTTGLPIGPLDRRGGKCSKAMDICDDVFMGDFPPTHEAFPVGPGRSTASTSRPDRRPENIAGKSPGKGSTIANLFRPSKPAQSSSGSRDTPKTSPHRPANSGQTVAGPQKRPGYRGGPTYHHNSGSEESVKNYSVAPYSPGHSSASSPGHSGPSSPVRARPPAPVRHGPSAPIRRPSAPAHRPGGTAESMSISHGPSPQASSASTTSASHAPLLRQKGKGKVKRAARATGGSE